MPGTREGKRMTRVTIGDVMSLLGEEYGPFEWRPRYDPASELVSTILSQHTSDVNSKRAFESLISTFGSLDAIAAADASDIEAAIRMGGLATVKAPRIKAILNQVREDAGSFDLSFLRDLPLADAKAWLTRLDGVGPKTAAIILCFSLGMPAMPVDTPRLQGRQEARAHRRRGHGRPGPTMCSKPASHPRMSSTSICT